MTPHEIFIPAFSVASIFLILVVIVVVVVAVVFFTGLGSKLESEREKTPGDSPFDRTADEGGRPEHTEVEDESKSTGENPSHRPRQPLMGRNDD